MATKMCPNCGAKNPSANRFCEDCGYDMNKVSDSNIISTTTATKAALFCPNGHSVSDTSLGFCDVCGEKLTNTKTVVHEPTPIPAVEEPYSEAVTPRPDMFGIKCPLCGAMNPENSTFCEECGKRLTDEEPDADSSVPSRSIKCPSCGMMNPEDGIHCTECGKALTITSVLDEPKPPRATVNPGSRVLPDIPDIMRPLTNENMKR